jgi:thiamine pyrophosphate-dependent acetolactate synthase large subunit-like protein
MTKMTTEEAFVKVLQMHGIENAFGIIGSAFMPISDLFPKAGITFWDVAHESNGGLIADGYTRSTGKIAMCIAQNGPGITGLVTPIKTAYWNHTSMLLVTPQAANKTMGQGGFQEVEQMNLFKDMVCYQEEVRDPSRMAEVLNRVIEKSIRGSAPAQINVPRDYWTQVIDIELPPIVRLERSAGGASAVVEAAKLLSNAKFPVILSGAGVVIGNAIEDCKKLAEKLDAPVCNGYQHNDSFPGSHPLAVGPLGYNGSKAAMELIFKADVVLALGTRLNPFSTLPGYGIDYWPKKANIIQENDYPTFEKGRKYLAPGLFGPCGYGFPAILGAKIGCPNTPVVGFAGDGAFGISMSEMSSINRKEWPGITMVIFRNYQWGAEKRNSILWFDDNFIGTELDPKLSFAKVAEGCGLKGVQVKTQEELTNALKESCKAQSSGITTFIEVILNQELGEPFRRDAMKKPVKIAGISSKDMCPQKTNSK